MPGKDHATSWVVAATGRIRCFFWLRRLVTQTGVGFTAGGFGNWCRGACRAAGIPDRSAHVLRKSAATRLADAGCTEAQIKGVTGRQTSKEVERYTKARDQRLLAESATAPGIHHDAFTAGVARASWRSTRSPAEEGWRVSRRPCRHGGRCSSIAKGDPRSRGSRDWQGAGCWGRHLV